MNLPVQTMQTGGLVKPARSAVKREREGDDLAPSKRTRRQYKRYPKPPYTYQAMVLVAIETSPSKRLTLSGVQDRLGEMFTFFRGEYKGWRDSVRHNLSNHSCFVRIPLNGSDSSKGCFWSVDLTHVTAAVFKRTPVGDIKKRSEWAENIFLQLDIPEIVLPAFPKEQTTSLQYQQTDYSSQHRHQTASVPRAGFTIDSILSKPTMSVEPPDTKFDHPFSFLSYRTPGPVTDVNSTPYDATVCGKPDSYFPPVPQCPVPSYGESQPFSYIASEFMVYPDYGYLSPLEYQHQSPFCWGDYYPNQTASFPHTSQHTAASQMTDMTRSMIPSQSDQSSAKLYRPFEESATLCSTNYRCPSSTTTSNPIYDSDTSSDVFCPRTSGREYIPPHPSSYSSDSSDAYMDPSSATATHPRPSSWGTCHRDIASYKTLSTSASLVAAVDDLAMFSEDSTSSSQRPVIPIPVFSDDSPSSPSNVASRSGVPDLTSLYGIARTDLIPNIDVISVSSEASSRPEDVFSNFGAMLSG